MCLVRGGRGVSCVKMKTRLGDRKRFRARVLREARVMYHTISYPIPSHLILSLYHTLQRSHVSPIPPPGKKTASTCPGTLCETSRGNRDGSIATSLSIDQCQETGCLVGWNQAGCCSIPVMPRGLTGMRRTWENSCS